MATESGKGEQEVVEVIVAEYDDLTFNEIPELETLS